VLFNIQYLLFRAIIEFCRIETCDKKFIHNIFTEGGEQMRVAKGQLISAESAPKKY
jgi:hypothetical protein